MPTVTRNPVDPRLTRGRISFDNATGWCGVCYEAGQYTLADGSVGGLCAFHARLSGPVPPPPTAGTMRRRRPGTAPRGGAPAGRAPAGGRVGWRPVERVPGRVLARGRRRAATRVDAGVFEPHPGWRNFCLPVGAVVLVDQAAALRRVDRLLAAECGWREDRRRAWRLMLRALVSAMDWESGLVTGLTAVRIGAAAGRSTRTVTDVIRWAKDRGLLVVVEEGATAEFLGARHNRTPTYALLADPADPVPAQPVDQVEHELCDLSHVPVGHEKPLPGGRRLRVPPARDWPAWRVPETPAERTAAVRTLAGRIGLDRPGVALWRARALLHRWFEAGWCVAGLIHALDYHPDHPDQRRGDALRGAADPVRVLGHRLRPWTGRHPDLPAQLHGRRGDYQHAQAVALAARLRDRAHAEPDQPTSAPASAGQRAAARGLYTQLRAAATRTHPAGGALADSPA